MSVRRNTDKRLTLVRTCGTCGQRFITSASSPWMRQVPRDGKRQATTYYCSTGCYQASYKHIGWYDGLYWKRKAERDAARYTGPNREKYLERGRKYREEHREEINEKARKKYWENHDEMLRNMRFYREKRKLIAMEAENGKA